MRFVVQQMDSKLGKDAVLGAADGARAWLAFAAVECVYSTFLSWMVIPHYLPPDARLTLALFALYPAWGGLVGGVGGVLLGAWHRRAPRELSWRDRMWLVVVASIPLTSLLHLQLLWPYSELVLFAAAVDSLIVGALVLSWLSAAWASRLSYAANPWMVSFVVVGVPWTVRTLVPSTSGLTKVAVGLFVPTLALGIGIVLATLFRSSKLGGRPMQRYAAGVSVAILLSVLPRQTAYTADPVAETPSARGAPNVVLIVMDTVRADHLSAYGYERDTTPNLESLLGEATLFTNAIATGDMTLISHASMMTGLYGRTHGAHFDHPSFSDGRPLGHQYTTLAESLEANGYRTLGIVANYAYLSRDFGLYQGFHHYDDRAPSYFFAPGQPFLVRERVRLSLGHLVAPETRDKRFKPAAEINHAAFELIADSASDGPFLLFLNYMDAHWPYLPPPPYDQKYPGKMSGYSTERFYALKERLMSLAAEMPQPDREHLVSQYDGAIAYLDAQLGELFRFLKRRDLYDNTIILITSDHGEAFGGRAFLEHAVSTYQNQVRVPLIVKFPGEHEPAVVDNVVSGVDLMPTILQLTGVPVPPGLEGTSLTEATSDAAVGGRVVLSESFGNPYFLDYHPRFERTERAVFKGSMKLIKSTKGKRELYALGVDPGERNDRADENQTVAAALEGDLDEWLASVSAHAQPDASTTPGEEVLRQLRSLGYIR